MGRNLPVIDGPDGAIAVGADLSSDRRVVRRDIDRQIALAGVALALAFIVAAAVALAVGRGAWTVLHLVLAGAAGTAIVAVMWSMSVAPRPHTIPSTRSPEKGSRLQPDALTGTTSVCPMSSSVGAFLSLPSIRVTRLTRPGADV